VQLRERAADHQQSEKVVLAALRREFGNEPTVIRLQAVLIAATKP
jgi:hypothetical protein